jgi:hypothetical protein
MEARSRNHRCRLKASSIAYSECVSVALVTQHAKRMRRVILSSVAWPAVPYFSTLSHKRQIDSKRDFHWENFTKHITRYNFATISLTDFYPNRKQNVAYTG